MWDSVTHVRNVTLGESKQRIYTIDILASDEQVVVMVLNVYLHGVRLYIHRRRTR